jgi:hypothetical protein
VELLPVYKIVESGGTFRDPYERYNETQVVDVVIETVCIATRKRTLAKPKKRRQTKKQKQKTVPNQHWHPFTDAYSAYLAGDYPALHDLEMRAMYGDDWEQKEIDQLNARHNHADDEEAPQEGDESTPF